MKLLAAFLLVGVFGSAFAAGAENRITFIDDYLLRWSRFAQGDNSLVPFLRDNKPRFEESLAIALRDGDKRAVSRVVFYAVVQVGGFIDVDTPLGREISKIFGPLPLTRGNDGRKLVFAGDLYFWWKEKRHLYPPYSEYDRWEETDFARSVVVPMYERVRAQQKTKREPVDPAQRH